MRSTLRLKILIGLFGGTTLILLAFLLYRGSIEPYLSSKAMGEIQLNGEELDSQVVPSGHLFAAATGAITMRPEQPEPCPCREANSWITMGRFALPVYLHDLSADITDPNTVWRGTIAFTRMVSETDWGNLQQETGREGLRVVLYVLDIKPVNETNYILTMVAAALLLLCGAAGIVTALRWLTSIRTHPQYKTLGRFGAPVEEVIAAADRELRGANEKIGNLTLTQRLLFVTGGSFALMRLKDVVWVYPHIPEWIKQINPAGDIESVFIYDTYGTKAQLKGGTKRLNRALEILGQRAPWAFFGYNETLAEAWKTDRTKLTTAVKAWREQAEAQTLAEARKTDRTKLTTAVTAWREQAEIEPQRQLERPEMQSNSLDIDKRSLQSSIFNAIRTTSRRRALVGGIAALGASVAFLVWGLPFLIAKFNPPTPITIDDIRAGTVTFPTHFAQLDVVATYDTGFYYDSRWFYVVPSRDYYGMIQLGNRFLLLYSDHPVNIRQREWVGTLDHTDREAIDNVIRSIEEDLPVLEGQILPYTLNTVEPNSIWRWIGLVLLPLSAAAGLYLAVSGARQWSNPSLHPIWKGLARYGKDVPAVISDIEQNVRTESTQTGVLTLSADWLVKPGNQYAVMKLDDIVWMHHHVERTRVNAFHTQVRNFAIFYDKLGTELKVPGNEIETRTMLKKVFTRTPWAVFGHSADIARTWAANRSFFVANVEQRKQTQKNSAEDSSFEDFSEFE
jgi:hypothetical protein